MQRNVTQRKLQWKYSLAVTDRLLQEGPVIFYVWQEIGRAVCDQGPLGLKIPCLSHRLLPGKLEETGGDKRVVLPEWQGQAFLTALSHNPRDAEEGSKISGALVYCSPLVVRSKWS